MPDQRRSGVWPRLARLASRVQTILRVALAFVLYLGLLTIAIWLPITIGPEGLVFTALVVVFFAGTTDIRVWQAQAPQVRRTAQLRGIGMLLLTNLAVLCIVVLFSEISRESASDIPLEHINPIGLMGWALVIGGLVWAYTAGAREPQCRIVAAITGALWSILAMFPLMCVLFVFMSVVPDVQTVIGAATTIVFAVALIGIAVQIRPRGVWRLRYWHGPTLTRQIGPGVRLRYPASEEETADSIEMAYSEAPAVIRDLWGLSPPSRMTLCVLTTPVRLFATALMLAPLARRAHQLLLLPFAYGQYAEFWPHVGACAISYPSGSVVGIKPPSLIERSNPTLGAALFWWTPDRRDRLRDAVCHELTHTATAQLGLPWSLNEGVAVWTSEKLMGYQRIRNDTLRFLREPPVGGKVPEYEGLNKTEAHMVYTFAHGYWLVRYLEEEHPGFLRGLFEETADQGFTRRKIVEAISRQLGMTPRAFATDIDGELRRHFGGSELSDTTNPS